MSHNSCCMTLHYYFGIFVTMLRGVGWNNFKDEAKLKVVKVLTSKSPFWWWYHYLTLEKGGERWGRRKGLFIGRHQNLITKPNTTKLNGAPPITKVHKMNSLRWFSWGKKAIFFPNLRMVENWNGCLTILLLSKKELVMKGCV